MVEEVDQDEAEDEAADDLGAFLAASPEFPDGSSGRIEQREVAREVEAIASTGQALRQNETAGAELFEVEVGDVSVQARLDGLLPALLGQREVAAKRALR